jgi:chemotaxis methyl-accepting protein methylase
LQEGDADVPLQARALVRVILRGTGVNPRGYRMAALARRIPACLRVLGAANESEALRMVARDARQREATLNTLLLGVTEFFRDREPYEALRGGVVQGLLRHRVGLRVLSAGCSDGSELYSLGMCVGEQRAMGSSQFWGIDCRRAAVETAKAGWYAKDSVRGIPAEFHMRYLRPAGGGYHMSEALRGKAHWEVADLWDFSAPRGFDLIACRNLAIYLAQDAAERLWRKLHAALTPGGVLFTGRAERPLGSFERIGPCLFRKVC